MAPNAQSIALHVVDDDHARSEVLTWDGRLDNRADLLLRLADAVRGDTSDAAIVLAAYQRWGMRGLAEIIGDWSVVIRDSGTRALILASDYAGVRPLYYHWQAARLDWSANLDAVVEAAGVRALDEQYVAGFLTFGGCPNRTPYAGVRSVPPGHAVRVTATGVTRHPFWAAPTTDTIRYRDERRYDEQLRGLFREAVAVRLQTSAPVLAELSGGFDSSSVVCMASQLIRSAAVAAPSLTTISYVHRDSLDLPFIDEIETFCAIDGVHLSTHEDRLISEAEVGNAMPECWAPVHRSVAGVADRLGAKLLLTGQNGDLVMGNWFDDSLQVAAALRRGQLRRAVDEAFAWSKVLRIPVGRILWRAMRALLPRASASPSLYTLDGGVAGPKSAETSLLPSFCARTGVDEPRRLFSDDWMQAPPERRKHFQALTSMRELRALQLLEPVQGFHYTHPFAHRPLVEFMMSIPADVLCGPGQPRKLMRRALADLWPPKLRARRSKSLFGAPWIEALRPLALTLLKSTDWHVVERGWVDRTSLAARLDKVTKGLDCNEPQLRQIIMLEWWLRKRGQGQGRSSEALLQAS